MEALKERTVHLNQILKDQKADFHIRYEKVKGYNNHYKEGYCFIKSGKIAKPICYIDSEEWMDKNDEALADHLMNIYKHYEDNDVFDEGDHITGAFLKADGRFNKEFILEHVQFMLVNQCNIASLEAEGIYYKPYLDLVMVFQIVLPGPEMRMQSIKVQRSMLDSYAIDADDLFNHAMAYMRREKLVVSLTDLINEMRTDHDIPVCFVPESPMLVVTNKSQINGSGYMLCNTVIDELIKFLGDRFVVLPSSIHETICVSYEDEESLDTLKKLVGEVNREVVHIEDWLSDHIYLWNKDHYEMVS